MSASRTDARHVGIGVERADGDTIDAAITIEVDACG